MKTNSFFNLNRFVLLAKQDLMINRNMYVLTFLVFAFGLYGYIVFQMNEYLFDYVDNAMIGYTYWGLYKTVLMGFAVFVGTSFSGFGNKVKCVSYLLIPASAFEKYLYPLLFRMVFGWVVFSLLFWADAHLAQLTLMNTPKFISMKVTIAPFQFSMLEVAVGGVLVNLERFFSMAIVGMFLFAVPLFYRKQALIKAVLVFFVVLLTLVFVLVGFSYLFDPNMQGLKVSIQSFKVFNYLKSVDLWSFFVFVVGWFCLLFLGYFKLKEKHI